MRLTATMVILVLTGGCARAASSGAGGTGAAPMPGGAKASSPVGDARQLVLVLTDDWSTVPGTLRRYERASAGAAWAPAGDAIPVVVGKGGLGWGIGLHGEVAPAPGPVKREGDGKAPAGAFRIGSAFGYAPREDVPWVRLPYIHSTDDWKCVDDTASRYYNQVVDERAVTKDWNSHEDMRLASDAYRLGAIVEHNWDGQTRRGGGSCIFLHIWGGPTVPTVGCTAMAPENIEALLRWLDPAAEPVLVQLTREGYDRVKSAWRLP